MNPKVEPSARLAADLDTPAVTILLDRMEANIARAQDRISKAGRANRPHIKTHKIPAIAAMQIAAGATGLTCQKLGEAEVFIDAGITDDILITFNIVGEAKTERLCDSPSGSTARRRRRQRCRAARPFGRRAPPRPRAAGPGRVRLRLRAQRRPDARRQPSISPGSP